MKGKKISMKIMILWPEQQKNELQVPTSTKVKYVLTSTQVQILTRKREKTSTCRRRPEKQGTPEEFFFLMPNTVQIQNSAESWTDAKSIFRRSKLKLEAVSGTD